MLDLLNNYSIKDIGIFIIILSLAIKGVIEFYDWAKNKIFKIANKEYDKKEIQEKILLDIQNHSRMINDISKSVNILVESDKDDIKSWITEKHHYFCYNLGYIDDYNLQCIEARYKHYKEEDGNTFIDGFMEDIRELPIVSNIKK